METRLSTDTKAVKYLACVGLVLGLILVLIYSKGTSSGSSRIFGVNGVSTSKVEIGHRRIRYSEASDRYIDFGYDYNEREIVVYIPAADRWEREKPEWARGRRTEIVGEVKTTCNAKMKPKPIYEEY